MNNHTEIKQKGNSKRGNQNRHIVDVLFVLALFCVFAASALMLVTLGANVYKQIVSDMDKNFEDRTAYSYVIEKLRQNDTSGAIEIGELEGTPALMLTEQIGDEEYCTYLYLYNGFLKELSIRKDSFAGNNIRSAGQNIMELSEFSMEEPEKGLLKLELDTGNGEPIVLYASLRSDN